MLPKNNPKLIPSNNLIKLFTSPDTFTFTSKKYIDIHRTNVFDINLNNFLFLIFISSI